jgi:cbb3-type cytochrome oxidase cytochrome c subunit
MAARQIKTEFAEKSAVSRHWTLAGATAIIVGVLVLVGFHAARSQPAQRDAPHVKPSHADEANKLFRRDNLIAWCIVPFDGKKRSPQERAEMLERIGVKRLAYDYRAEHIKDFDAELDALARRHIKLDAWWFPTELNDEAKLILATLARHKLTTQLWVMGGGEPTNTPAEQAQRVAAEVARLRPIAEAAARQGCQVGLYNHGGWFGEPENQLEILAALKMDNVGIVYNLHHGHDQVDRLPQLLAKMKPHLMAITLNGMVRGGDRKGQMIMPLGTGELDLKILKMIRDSGYRGPLAILNHTDHDAEARLLDNIDGLNWLVPQLDGQKPDRKPRYRTYQSPTKEALVPGRFGAGLNATRVYAEAEYDAALGGVPLAVECWTKLYSKGSYNILIANQLKSSPDHWELFTMPGTGRLAIYLPGYEPDHVTSDVDLVNNQWRHVAMTHDGAQVRLFVDGKQIAAAAVKRVKQGTTSGPLWIGAYEPPSLLCDGVIDEVRISSGVREINAAPSEPYALERSEDSSGPAKQAATKAATLRLFHFDSTSRHGESEILATPDDSPHKAGLQIAAHGRAGAADRDKKDKNAGGPAKITGHWGEDAIGFRWTEGDSVDGRWNEMNVGHWMSCSLPTPLGSTAKGLSLRLAAPDGATPNAAVCYDTATMSLRCGWTGGFIAFDPARFGLINMPRMQGDVQFASAAPGWGKAAVQYRGMRVGEGARSVLAYRIGDVDLLESPSVEKGDAKQTLFVRTFQLAAHDGELATEVAHGEHPQIVKIAGLTLGIVDRPELKNAPRRIVAVGTIGEAATIRAVGDDHLEVAFDRRAGVSRSKVFLANLAAGDAGELDAFAKAIASSPAAGDLELLAKPGPRQWRDTLTTRGVLGAAHGAYAVDTLTLPTENPYKALLFVSGHDFFASGDAAICTVHGDVWIVRGIDDGLQKLTWQRFATGLFQPLGLKIVDDAVYVLGRDQITRLVDRNGDGEADEYVCFNNSGFTSTGGHDYATCLETDSAGDFYYLRCGNEDGATPNGDFGLTRVPRDGRGQEIVATGIRNPNGMSIGPNDTITVAPQEGEWTPGSAVLQVRRGGHYGFLGPRTTSQRPLGYDLPLAWIPRIVDNSSGGQVWATDARFGPLRGALLHLSFGRCWPLLVLRDEGSNPPQGAIVRLPLSFASGAMRGRVRPADGQVYVSGLKGWATSAAADGCFQRIRYTGAPARLPIGIAVQANGVLLRFSDLLERESAEDPDNYAAEAWNYRYSKAYGSADYRPSQPKQEGHDEVKIASATLQSDGKSVFIEIPQLQPVMQLAVQVAIRSADRQPVEHTVYATVHRLPDRRMEPGPHARLPRPGELSADELAHLQPGILARFEARQAAKRSPQEQHGTATTRRQRLFALAVAKGETPANGMRAGPFTAQLTGYVKSALRGDATFSLAGRGRASLRINDREVTRASGDLSTAAPATVALRKGYNRIELVYESTDAGDGQVRLLWSAATFACEPVPPTALWFDDRDPQWQTSRLRDRGRTLVRSLRCTACHGKPGGVVMADADRAPDLAGIGERCEADWIARWLLAPHHMASEATMPSLLNAAADASAAKQTAADLAAYVAMLPAPKNGAPSPTPPNHSSRDQAQTAAATATGETLYEELGCVKCHSFAAPSERDKYQRVSLRFAAKKFRMGQLSEYLMAPHRHFPATRMPDFKLSGAEAQALEEYLRAETSAVQFDDRNDFPGGDAARGKAEFVRLNCAKCHRASSETKETNRTSLPREKFGPFGCLQIRASDAASKSDNAPDFRLSEPDRAAILAFLDAARDAADFQESSVDAASRLFASLRCAQCHSRDGVTSPGAQILLDDGSGGVAEPIPSLTWAGEKLRARWLDAFLRGKLDYRPRPWLAARMPLFHGDATTLAAGLAAEHGMADATQGTAGAASPTVDAAQALVGDELTRKERGLDCRLCHAPRDELLKLTNEAQGIGLARIAERLNVDYYRRWMFDPTRIDPAARMPKFAVDGRRTTAVQMLGGEAGPQFDAIWEYLRSIDESHGAPQSGDGSKQRGER